MNQLDEAEVQGRLAFIMSKYAIDLETLRLIQGRLGEAGVPLYANLEAGFDELYSRCATIIAGIGPALKGLA